MIKEYADRAPTVEQIQQATRSASNQQQAAAQPSTPVYNIPHNPSVAPTQAAPVAPQNPNTSRTSPPAGTNGGNTGPGGFWTP